MTIPVIDVYGKNARPALDVTIQAVTDLQANVTAANSAATVVMTAPAKTGQVNIISQIFWSYSANPTGGRLTIQDNTGTVFDQDIAIGTAGKFYDNVPFYPPREFLAGSAVTVTLAAGGVGVTGKLHVSGWTQL